MRRINIAIDGPSGAGKSTLARMTAERLGYVYIDTGAIYRSVALYVLKSGADPKDPDAVAKLLPDIRVELKHDVSGLQRMYLNGEDVTEQIRTPEVSIVASDTSAMPAVRRALIDMQRGIAKNGGVVMDGRDIGTVVLPDAEVKIFLTATPEERARRRCRELKEKGLPAAYEDVLRDMIYRDKNDSTRASAPLRQAEDAVLLDTTELTLEESFEAIKNIVSEIIRV